MKPGQIVGFKFSGGVWSQIPVQVDERALLDIVTPYGPLASGAGYTPSASNPKILFYCDTSTYVGADPDTTFDSNDELVFMLKDAGGQSDGSLPIGVVAGTCTEITLTDPLGGTGFVYLFKNAGALQQSAGISYVNYSSNLASTTGFPANLNTTNSENTSITTSDYFWHFSAEWVCDQLKIVAGTNTDILDRYKNFFANGNCGRHEDTFSAAENAFICVKPGPVRVIRSYMGANSGPLTERTHLFYENRQDITTDLRVHHIASIYDVFDYNSAANGMIYRNNLNTAGITIDGVQDVLNTGDVSWEQVSGAQGTLSILLSRSTSLTGTEATFRSYYDDNSVSPASTCTGDGQAWGTSGGGTIFINSSVCTDPMGSGCAGTQYLRNLQYKRTLYVDGANGADTTAADYFNKINHPLTFSITSCQTDTNFSVSTSSNPFNGGMTYGGGSFLAGSTVNFHAVANSGWQFVNWTENAVEVSTDSVYSFTIHANRELVANFVSANGIDQKNQEAGIIIFPNPCRGTLNITSVDDYLLEVKNPDGRLILKKTIKTGTNVVEIEEQGTYFLQFLNEKKGNVSRRCVVIKH